MHDTPRTPDPEQLLEHAAFVRSVAAALLRDPAAVDDVVQETWVRALVRPPCAGWRLESWLAGVATHVARTLTRSGARRSRREAARAQPEALPSAAETVVRLETLRLVVDAVQELREPYRQVVLLRHFDGLPPRAISRLMGVPVETIGTRLRRAHAQLRGRLDASHEGGRHAWSLALLPLSAPRAAPELVSAGSIALLSGALLMKTKVILAGAAALLLAVVAFLWVVEPPGAGPGPASPAATIASAAEPAAPPDRSPERVAARDPLATPERAAPGRPWFSVRHVRDDRPLALLPLDVRTHAALGEARWGVAGGPRNLLRDEERHRAGAPSVRVVTDRAGVAAAGALPPGPYEVSVPDPFVYLCDDGIAALPAAGEPLTLHVEDGTRIVGSVVGSAGSPLAGALVGAVVHDAGFFTDAVEQLFWAKEPRQRVGVAPPLFSPAALRFTRTDAAGRYALDGVPARMKVTVFVAGEDHAPGRVEVETPYPFHTVEAPILALARGATLAVHVEAAATNAPVAAAQVELQPEGMAAVFPRATTGGDGRARIDRIAPGAWELIVRAPGFAAQRRSLRLAEGATVDAKVSLAAGAHVAGFVRDSRTGDPVAGAELRATIDQVRFEVVTAADGAFRLDGLRGGSVALDVKASGYRSARLEGVATPADGFEIRLSSGGSIHGVVLDETGRPAPEFRLSHRLHTKNPFDATPSSRRVQDPQGRFDVGLLAPGKYVLIAQREGSGGGGSASEPIEIRAEETVEGVVLTLRPDCEVRGVVVDTVTKQPVAHATVRVQNLDELRLRMPVESFRRALASHGAWSTKRTESDGSFVIGCPSGARCEVQVEAPDRELAVRRLAAEGAPADLGAIELRLQPAVRGRVTDAAGNPLPGVPVFTAREGSVLARFFPFEWSQTDPMGEYVVRAPPGASCIVRVSSDARAGPGLWAVAREVPLADGMASGVDFVAPRCEGRVRGVVRRAGAPVPGASVVITLDVLGEEKPVASMGAPQRTVVTGADGTFELDALMVGRYAVQAILRADGGRSSSVRQAVEVGVDPAFVELELGVGATAR